MERIYRDVFFNTDTEYTNDINSIHNNLNIVYSRYLNIDLTKESIEFPVLLRSSIHNIIPRLFSEDSYTEMSIPLYFGGISFNRRTFDSVIKDLFYRTSFSNRLTKIIHNEDVYYGMKGIILDSEFNILVLCTLTYSKAEETETKPLNYIKSTIYINPKVFINDKDFMNKGIVKKLLPCYLSNPIRPYGSISVKYPSIITPEVVIKDVTKDFIYCPSKPEVRSDINDVLNQVLVDNVSEILTLIN